MQYAVLGSIQFELITYFSGLEGTWKVDFASHERVQGKPRLQWIGDGADEWKLKLKFHRRYCNPETELAKLRKALAEHKALAFVLANGDYKGMFVLTDIASSAGHTDTNGALIDADVALTLREDPDAPPPKPAKPAVKAVGAPAPAGAVKAAPAAARAPAAVGVLGSQRVLAAARSAAAAVEAWRYGGVSEALGELGDLADHGLRALGLEAGALGRLGIPGISGTGRDVAIQAATARGLLVGLTSGNLAGRRMAMGLVMSAIGGQLSPLPRAMLAIVRPVVLRR